MHSRIWLRELRRLVLGAAVLVIAGALTGLTVWFLLLGTLAYLGWHLYHLHALAAWLDDAKHRDLPNAGEPWHSVYETLKRLQRSKRKRKRRLRKVMKRFRQAAEASPDAAVILGADGRIVWFNGAASDVFGFRHPTDLRQPISNLVRSPAFVQYIGAGDFEEPLEMFSPVNEAVYLQIRLVPYAGDRSLLLARDVSRLRALEQMRRDFVANVSHELRSPLTVIVGYLETLSDNPDTPGSLHRPLQQMSQQATRMCRIVEDLLKLSRIENDPGGASLVPVQVGDMLESIRSDAVNLSSGAHDIQVEAEPGLRLLGDYNELYSAFSNLVFNAVQYSPNGGEIRLRWFSTEKGAVVEVEDAGIGIEPHHLARLTERFYRVDKARSREVGGTGLGLAIVKHVLVRHDASLNIRSEVDGGSVFACNFPASRLARDARLATSGS